MLYKIIFFITITTLLAWEILRVRFVDQLRDEFENIWVSLGRSKGLIARLFILDDLTLEKYVHARKFRELTSPNLIEKGEKLYYMQLFGTLVLIIALIVIFFGP